MLVPLVSSSSACPLQSSTRSFLEIVCNAAWLAPVHDRILFANRLREENALGLFLDHGRNGVSPFKESGQLIFQKRSYDVIVGYLRGNRFDLGIPS